MPPSREEQLAQMTEGPVSTQGWHVDGVPSKSHRRERRWGSQTCAPDPGREVPRRVGQSQCTQPRRKKITKSGDSSRCDNMVPSFCTDPVVETGRLSL